MNCDHISDCIEEKKLTIQETKHKKSKVRRLNRRFAASRTDIELAQSVVNQESAAALKEYRNLRIKILEQRPRQGDEFEINNPAASSGVLSEQYQLMI